MSRSTLKAPRVRSAKRLDFKALAEPECWEAVGDKVKCLPCLDGNIRDIRAAVLHERVAAHQRAAKRFLQIRREQAAADSARTSIPFVHAQAAAPSRASELLNLFRQAAESRLGARGNEQFPPEAKSSAPTEPEWVDLQFGNDSDDEEDFYGMNAEQAQAHLCESLMQFLERVHIDSDSDDESVNAPPSESSSSSEEENAGIGASAPRVRSRTFDPTAPFFPWGNKQEISFDLLMHLMRSVFSERQLDLLHWMLRFNGVDNMPSVSSIKALDVLLQAFCGIETREYVGKMGHRYHVNSLADLIAQEHANPRVSENLSYLPVETNGRVENPCESRKWLHDIDPSLATPMIRRGDQDFYVFEPTLLTPTSRLGRVIMPKQWFIRDGVRFARAWRLSEAEIFNAEAGRPIRGWCVHEWETIDVPEHELLLAMPRFSESHQSHGLPSPHVLHGSFLTSTAPSTAELAPWVRTAPSEGNVWRARAQGSEVRAFPIWLYCDDTSGNQSKKWNKHNSFLFTPAGLPREHAHQEYNVHFLTTSNIAPVPEMLDGVVNEIEMCQQNGVWAFDHKTQSVVLLLPFVLGLLGDNPMQSELACHIGMKGKFFCRACWVDRGKAADDDGSDSEAEEPVAPAAGKKRRKKAAETARDMLSRIKRFVTLGRPRVRSETLETVNELEKLTKTYGNLDAIKNLKTATGVKDTSLQFFIDKFESAMKGKRARTAREGAFERAKADLPSEDLRSAIFRLKGLDPHRDTPVEILHVILIGVIKYFWRDVVKNQCSTEQKQNELIARLDSFDTSGLGISPLRGHTLVTYAGSLVGRDFRAIAQAGPFVLQGLVSPDCYRAWVELAALVPLVWQPVIEDMEDYVPRLTVAIENLLAATAEWSPRWFNKPKFHLLLHLPDHIRRFGPAILFATEAFESFNAVIRAKSIHSNRQAPSRDIAVGFAHGNRIRHLLSGGWIRPYQPPSCSPADPKKPASPSELREHRQAFRQKKPSASEFLRAGARVASLVELYPTVRSYLGIYEPETRLAKAVTLSGCKIVPYESTLSFSRVPAAGIDRHDEVAVVSKLGLVGGDAVSAGSWVLVAPAQVNRLPSTPPALARVEEIVRCHTVQSGPPDTRLLVKCPAANPVLNSQTYLMPVIPPLQHWFSVPIEAVICAANVQHNCASHGCAATGRRAVLQERQTSSQTRAVVSHLQPADVILNLGQMRSAVHLQKLAIARPRIDMEKSLERGVEKHFRSLAVDPAPPQSVPPAGSNVATGVNSTAQQHYPQPRPPDSAPLLPQQQYGHTARGDRHPFARQPRPVAAEFDSRATAASIGHPVASHVDPSGNGAHPPSLQYSTVHPRSFSPQISGHVTSGPPIPHFHSIAPTASWAEGSAGANALYHAARSGPTSTSRDYQYYRTIGAHSHWTATGASYGQSYNTFFDSRQQGGRPFPTGDTPENEGYNPH